MNSNPAEGQYGADSQKLFPFKLTELPPSDIFARILEDASLRHGLEFLLFITKEKLAGLSEKELNAYEQWLSLYQRSYKQIRHAIIHSTHTKKFYEETSDSLKAT